MKELYFELFLSFAIVAITLASVWVIGFLSKKSAGAEKKTSAEITLYYSENCECFETDIQRLLLSSCIRAFDARIMVVDLERSEESKRYLEALREKLDFSFEIL